MANKDALARCSKTERRCRPNLGWLTETEIPLSRFQRIDKKAMLVLKLHFQLLSLFVFFHLENDGGDQKHDEQQNDNDNDNNDDGV